jgi:hypothetical protein
MKSPQDGHSSRLQNGSWSWPTDVPQLGQEADIGRLLRSLTWKFIGPARLQRDIGLWKPNCGPGPLQ